MLPERTQKVAAIANQFIQHARYKLTPREQKLILYMATQIRPEDSDFSTYLVPVTEIEHILKQDATKKHGSFYERLDDLLDSITDKKIAFPTEFLLEGRPMRGFINWVAGAVPKYDRHGTLCVEFGFSPQMKPFLLGLKQKFTKIEFLEVAKMRSGFSIRIFQMCKAYYYENERHGRNVLKVGVDELKHRLGIGDKYPDWRNFRRKVLEIAQEEVNERTSLNIEYDYGRRGRKIVEVMITITEKDGSEAHTGNTMTDSDGGQAHRPGKKSRARVALLTEAKRRAFNKLADYKVNMSVILDEILPIIRGSEMEGFEDYFVDYMLAFFEQKTNRRSLREKAKAFIGWVRNGRFQEPNTYAALCEQVIARKKNMTPTERANRELAKTMTAREFQNHFRTQDSIGRERQMNIGVKAEQQQQRTPSKAGRTLNLFDQGVPGPFNLAEFREQYPEQYRRIRLERKVAFKAWEDASNYKSLLENSIVAYCEKWMREHG